MRARRPGGLLLLALVLALFVFMGITPLLGFYALLMIAFSFRGSCLGFSQVLMISILGRALDPTTQGKGVGLRTTINRVMNAGLPPVVGAIVAVAGLENAFYIVCGGAAVLMVPMYLYALHHKGFRQPPPEPATGGQ